MKPELPSLIDRETVRKVTPTNNRIPMQGKYGIGDACWALNIAHNTAKVLSEKITIDYHWKWDRNYLYSYDDVENIIEQVDYLKNFYDRPDSVEIVHHLNSSKKDILDSSSRLLHGPDPAFRKTRQSNWWKFNPDLKLPAVDKKVVIWRSKFNSDRLPDRRKERINDADWDLIIQRLKNNGFVVVEISYRTPVREAMYHINTCSSTIGYAGMWYYFANNWQKPCMIVSDRPITRVHSPSCMEISDKKLLLSICDNYNDCEEMIDLYCLDRYNIVNQWITNL